MGKVYNRAKQRWEDVRTGSPVAAPAPNTTFAKEAQPLTGLTLPGGATSTAGARLAAAPGVTFDQPAGGPPSAPGSAPSTTSGSTTTAPRASVASGIDQPASSAAAQTSTVQRVPYTPGSISRGFDAPQVATPGSTLTMFGPQGPVQIPTGSSVSAMPGNRALVSTGDRSHVIGGNSDPIAGFEASRTVGADGTTHIVAKNGGTVDIPAAPGAVAGSGTATGITGASGQQIVRNGQGNLVAGTTPAAPAAPVSAAPTAMAAAGMPTLPTPNFAPVPTSPQNYQGPISRGLDDPAFGLNSGAATPSTTVASPNSLTAAASKAIGNSVPVMAASDFAAPRAGTVPSQEQRALAAVDDAATPSFASPKTSSLFSASQPALAAINSAGDISSSLPRPGAPAAPATNPAATGSLSSASPASPYDNSTASYRPLPTGATPGAAPASTVATTPPSPAPSLPGKQNLLGQTSGNLLGSGSSFSLQGTATPSSPGLDAPADQTPGNGSNASASATPAFKTDASQVLDRSASGVTTSTGGPVSDADIALNKPTAAQTALGSNNGGFTPGWDSAVPASKPNPSTTAGSSSQSSGSPGGSDTGTSGADSPFGGGKPFTLQGTASTTDPSAYYPGKITVGLDAPSTNSVTGGGSLTATTPTAETLNSSEPGIMHGIDKIPDPSAGVDPDELKRRQAASAAANGPKLAVGS